MGLPLSPFPPLPFHLITLTAGALVALGLTAFYWLPVAMESRYVAIAQDVGGLGFERHLAPLTEWLAAGPAYRYFPEQGVAGEHPLSWAQGALLGVALLGLPRLWRGPQRWPALFWWLTLALTLFLLTPLSVGLWRTFVFPFGLVQYPWRWLGLTSLATAMVVSSLGVAWRGERKQKVALGMLGLLLGGLAFSSMQHLPWQGRAVDVARHPVPMWEEDAANGQVGATWTAEFLPRTVQEQRWALARAPETVAGVGSRTPLRVTRLLGGRDAFSVEVTAEEAGWLTFPRFAYPSMQATVDGVVQPIVPRGALGLASVWVPAGEHKVLLWPQPLSNGPWLELGLRFLAVVGLHLGLIRWQRWALPLVWIWMMVAILAPENVPRYGTPSETIQPLTFGEQATLLSYRRPTSVAPGDTLPVTLTWFNHVQTDQGYNTFVHLTPRGGGAPVAQHDGPPNMGTVPTQRWLPGQLVQDLHLLTLPPDLPPGDYDLWAGLYATQNNTAAPLAGDSGAPRLLGVLSITE